ncbi:hypothetical protein Tco_0157138 [Tanacetum coccineum]
MSKMDDDLFTYEVEFFILVLFVLEVLLSVPVGGTRGDDEVELTDEEYSNSDNDDEVVEIFRIDTNVFDFETPTNDDEDVDYNIMKVGERWEGYDNTIQ